MAQQMCTTFLTAMGEAVRNSATRAANRQATKSSA